MIKYLVFIPLVIFSAMTYRDYGISSDEYLHVTYGQKVLAYLTSFFADKSFKTYHNLRFYGGWFDMTATGLGQLFGVKKGLAFYEFKHLLNSFIGIFGCYGLFKFMKRYTTEINAGLVAVLLFTTTLYNGQLFYNPKDIPFAAFYIWGMFYLVQYFSSRKKSDLFYLCLFTGLTIGIRAGGVLLYFYFAVAILFFDKPKEWFSKRNIVAGVIFFLGAYVIAAIGWPYLIYKPFKGLYETIHIMSKFGWDGDVFFEGTTFFSKKPPLHYLPKMFLIKLPLLTSVMLLCYPIYLGYQFFKKREIDREFLFIVVISFFPMAYAMAVGSTVYNGIRQFIFLVPPFTLIACYTLTKLLGKRSPYFFITQILVNGIVIYQLYPYQHIAYNAFVGGTEGANGRYELEYWGMSRSEGAKMMKSEKKSFYTPRPMTTFYFHLPRGISVAENPSRADYAYILKHSGQEIVPPKNKKKIAEIRRGKIVLGELYAKP